MRVPNLALLLSVMANSYNNCSAFPSASTLPVVQYNLHKESVALASSFFVQPRALCSLAAADTTIPSERDQLQWRARQDCWRPDVRDVEKISWGMPAKKKRTGSRGVPHRLNEDERRSFDQARRQGFLQVSGSSWRSQRRDAPLLNSYRSLMDARGRPAIVLHKLSPQSSLGIEGDRLVVDLSPLRLPDEFERLGRELEEKVLAEFDVARASVKSDEGDEAFDTKDGNEDIIVNDAMDDEDSWENRPIYQLSPHTLSWEVSRQQGKQIGKYLGKLFDNVEEKAVKSTKPKGVKPGKERRHGGYGIG